MDSNNPIILSRVTVPRRRSDLLARPRLTKLLGDVLEKKLIVISAPAGYGKTSLVVDYAATCKMPVAWYCVDRLEQNPQRFLVYLIAAIQQRYPGFGKRTLSVMRENQSEQSLDFAVNIFLSDLFEHLTEHFTIVIDDYHLINGIAPIRSFMDRLLREIDENVHFILISRNLLTLPVLPILVSRSEVAGISYNELAFQADEIKHLYYQNQHMVLTDADALDIHQRTEGWITGIVLASQMNEREEIGRARLKRVSSYGLENYFLSIIDAMPADVRNFLLWSSILEEYNADLCRRILTPSIHLEDSPWQQWMSTIQQNNLFVLSVGERGDWIRYHPLFLEFLQNRVNKEYPVEAKKIETELAHDCITRKEWERAYQLYEKLKDPDAQIKLIEEYGYQILLDGKVALLSSWIDAYSHETLIEHPYLLSFKGYISMLLGDKTLALELYDQAINLFIMTGQQGFLARSLALRANLHRLLGNLDSAIADIDHCEEIISHPNDLPGLQGDLLRCRGLCSFHRGKLTDAAKWLMKGLTEYQNHKDRKNEAIIQMEIGLVNEQQGNYQSAQDWYNRAMFYWQEINNPFWLANLLNNLGVLYQMLGEYEHCIDAFQQALKYATAARYSRMEAYILTGLADLNLELQSYDAANVYYEKALGIAGAVQEHFLHVYILLQQASLAAYLGNFANGYQYIKTAHEVIGTHGAEMENYLCDLEFAGLKIAEGKGAEIEKMLQPARQYFKKSGQTVQCDRANLYQLVAAIQSEKEDQAMPQALYLQAKLQSQVPVSGLASLAARHITTLKQTKDSLISAHLQEILRSADNFLAQLPVIRKYLREHSTVLNTASPHYQIRSMGKLQVRIDDHLVVNSEWQTSAAKHLFFMLLAHPEGMTRDEICLIFWPDAAPDDARFRFKNTVYRLRRAVGKEVILLEQDYYRFNNKLNYEYDIEAFLKENAAALREKDPQEKITHLRAAIKSYSGAYAADVDADWAVNLRDVLQQNYISALLLLAEEYFNLGQLDAALEQCQKALQVDDLLEDSYRLALRVYAAMGNRSGLIKLYNTFVELLDEELSAEPSTQTKELFNSLNK
jgi:ATP/maltotriose-dependent transcriptional regulator MalT